METSEAESLNAQPNKSPMLLVMTLAVLAVGGYLLFARKESTTITASPSPAAVESQTLTATPVATSAQTLAPTEGIVKEIKVTGVNFRFNPSTVTVKKGDTVRITLTSSDMPHDFVIDELSVASDKVTSGKSTTVEFVADKPGEYEYYCSVSNHRAQGMVGTLTVTE